MADNSINGSIGLSADPGLALLEEENASKGFWWETGNGLTKRGRNAPDEYRRQLRERRNERYSSSSAAEQPIFTGGEGYRVYVDDLLLPVPPSKLELSIQNRNKTMDLVSGGQINLLKTPGLSEVKFTAILPNQPYHFAMYEGGYRNAHSYLDKLEALKVNRKSFPLRVLRMGPGGDLVMDNTSLTVSLEDYSILEDADQYGLDMAVDLTFKQFQPYGTKTYVLSGDTSATEVKQRDVVLTAGQTSYTLQEGDTLYSVAKKTLGDGAKWTEIYDLNKDVIEEAAKKDGLADSNNGNIVYAGTVLKIPPKASEQAVANGQNPAQISLANGGAMTMKSGAVVTSGKVVTIPSSVKQTGMIASYTNWIEPKKGKSWARGTNQRRLSDEWKNRGWTVNNSIATLNGYYLIATTTKFGNVGDVVCVYFENGKTLNCIIGDSKGANVKFSPYAGETGNEYGHAYGNSGVDVIEWEYGNRRSGNSQTDGDRLRAGLRALGISGQKVVKMINYGSWLDQ